MKNNRLCMFHLRTIRAVCAAVFVFATANSALAQDWRFEPILKVGLERDDNARLDFRTDEEIEAKGVLLQAMADIYYDSPTTSFFLQPKVISRTYKDEELLDSDDYFLRSNFRRQGILNTIGFRVNFDSQSVRTAERSDSDLEIEDPDEITNDDTGRVLLSGTRNRWRLSPYWEYQLSPLSSIRAEIVYRNTRYDDVFAGLLKDYTDTRLNLIYRRSISEVTTGLIGVTGRKYFSEDSIEDIDGYGVRVGVVRSLSEKTRVSADIGFENTDKSGVGETEPEWVGSVTFVRNLKTVRFFARYRRSESGSGAGGVSLRDSFNLNFRRRLNEKISVGLGVRAYQSKGGQGSGQIDDRNFVQLQSSLSWYLTRSLIFEADYFYTVLDRGDLLSEGANSNRINLTLVYQPKTIPDI